MRTARPARRPSAAPARRAGAALLGAAALVLSPALATVALADEAAPEVDAVAPAEAPPVAVDATIGTAPVAEVVEPEVVEPAAVEAAAADAVAEPAAEAAVEGAEPAGADVPAADHAADAPAADPTASGGVTPEVAPVDVELPAVEQEDQLVVPGAPEGADEVAPADVPIAGAFGTGKIDVGVAAFGDAPEGATLDGAEVEITFTSPDGTERTELRTSTASGAFGTVGTEAGESVTFTLTEAPDGFMITQDTVTVPACETVPEAPAGFPCFPSTVIFDVVEDYRLVVVEVTAEDGTLVPGATFDLLGPVDADDPAGGRALIGTAVSDSGGRAIFPVEVAPGEDLLLVNTAVPQDYELIERGVSFDLPAVATQAEAELPLVLTAVLAGGPVFVTPPPPSVTPLAVRSVSDGTVVFLDVLAQIDGQGEPVSLYSAEASHGGTVTLGAQPGCVTGCRTGILYRPAPGFAGVETILFEAGTAGGTVTGQVTVTVSAPVAAVTPVATVPVAVPAAPAAVPARPAPRAPRSSGPELARTGTEVGALLATAGGLVLAGLGGVVLTRRPARRQP